MLVCVKINQLIKPSFFLLSALPSSLLLLLSLRDGVTSSTVQLSNTPRTSKNEGLSEEEEEEEEDEKRIMK